MIWLNLIDKLTVGCTYQLLSQRRVKFEQILVNFFLFLLFFGGGKYWFWLKKKCKFWVNWRQSMPHAWSMCIPGSTIVPKVWTLILKNFDLREWPNFLSFSASIGMMMCAFQDSLRIYSTVYLVKFSIFLVIFELKWFFCSFLCWCDDAFRRWTIWNTPLKVSYVRRGFSRQLRTVFLSLLVHSGSWWDILTYWQLDSFRHFSRRCVP